MPSKFECHPTDHGTLSVFKVRWNFFDFPFASHCKRKGRLGLKTRPAPSLELLVSDDKIVIELPADDRSALGPRVVIPNHPEMIDILEKALTSARELYREHTHEENLEQLELFAGQGTITDDELREYKEWQAR